MDIHFYQIKIFLKLLLASLNNPAIILGKKKYIFILSHMRSYTSLLSHILGSHREICGYSETGQSYFGIYDLIMLRYKVCLANNNRLEGRFILDKILHNGCSISDQVMNRDDVYIIFMLRKPEETIKCLIKYWRKYGD